jgi:hypothetical protein
LLSLPNKIHIRQCKQHIKYININKQANKTTLLLEKSLSTAEQVCPKTCGFKYSHTQTAGCLHINMLYVGRRTVVFAIQTYYPHGWHIFTHCERQAALALKCVVASWGGIHRLDPNLSHLWSRSYLYHLFRWCCDCSLSLNCCDDGCSNKTS